MMYINFKHSVLILKLINKKSFKYLILFLFANKPLNYSKATNNKENKNLYVLSSFGEIHYYCLFGSLRKYSTGLLPAICIGNLIWQL